MLKKLTALAAAAAVFCCSCAASARELFTDVREDEWAAPYIYNLTDRGIVSGYGDGTFLPWNNVQRCEYAKMLVNIAGIKIVPSSVSPYADVPYGEWFFPYVNAAALYMTGFQDSDGNLFFSPFEPATREAVTVAMVKALSLDISQYDDPSWYLSTKFSDWDRISSHNRAYICAAVDSGVITGDVPDGGGLGTFRPSDPILRSEIVFVLYRAFPNSEG